MRRVSRGSPGIGRPSEWAALSAWDLRLAATSHYLLQGIHFNVEPILRAPIFEHKDQDSEGQNIANEKG